MIDFNSDEWVRKERNGRVYYDRKDLIDKPLPKYEDSILECFAEKFVYKDAAKFKQVEKDFFGFPLAAAEGKV